MVDNPWIAEMDESQPVVEPAPVEVPSWQVVGGIRVEDAVACALPVVLSDHLEDIVLVGAHGGAGTSTVAGLTGLVDGGHQWPVSAPVPNRVLVVARTHMVGLRAAQAAALRIYSGAVKGVDLVGVVLVADVPGRRLPRELAEMMSAVKGAYPVALTFDWMNELRVGKTPSRLTGRVSRFVEEIHTLNEIGKQ